MRRAILGSPYIQNERYQKCDELQQNKTTTKLFWDWEIKPQLWILGYRG